MKVQSASCRRRGVITVTVALLLVVMMGAAALAVDLGRMFFERRAIQSAADAAAEAAGMELYADGGIDCGQADSAARRIAEKFGYSNIIVNVPPKAGAFKGRSGYVEVVIDSGIGRSFSGVLASGNLAVGARSVAAGTTTPSKASVLILDPKRKDSLKLKGKGSSLQVAGDIVVDSKDKRSIQVGSKSQLVADHLLLTGGIDKKSRGLIDAKVETGLSATPDPYASLPIPSKGSSRDVNDFLTTIDGQQIYKLKPGNYKELKFDSNDAVSMEPGTYYVDGNFELKSSSSLSAAGVTIFQAGKRGMKFNTTGDVTITPPSDGAYSGVSLFQNPATKGKMEFKGGRNYNIGGVLYCPNGAVKFTKTDMSSSDDEDWEADELSEEVLADDSGAADNTGMSGSIICRQMTIDKGSHVQLNGANISVARPIRGLVE